MCPGGAFVRLVDGLSELTVGIVIFDDIVKMEPSDAAHLDR